MIREYLTHTQRKFVLALLVFSASCVFLATGHVDAECWFKVTQWNGGFLAAATVAEKFVRASK